MDHEISSSQLDDDQAGWDWASLQLNDGREIMAYRLRKKDGRTDPFSTLAWVDAQGARHESQQHAIHLDDACGRGKAPPRAAFTRCT